MEYLIGSTNDKIKCVAFTLFLEKGYEATKIRDICNEVGIKPSSLYFYYKSKQELFLSIYDEVWSDNIRFLESVEEFKKDISPDIKLYAVLKSIMEYCSKDIAKPKFLLRYHLFPPEELIKIIQEKYMFWTNKENIIITDLMKDCIDKRILSSNKNINDYIKDYVRFIHSKVIEMIIYNVKISSSEIYNTWLEFCNGSFSINKLFKV